MQPRLCRPKFSNVQANRPPFWRSNLWTATTPCKNRPVRCGRSLRWILPSGEQTRATSFPGSLSYPSLSLSLSRSVGTGWGTGRREPWGRGCRSGPINANKGLNFNPGFFSFGLKASSQIKQLFLKVKMTFYLHVTWIHLACLLGHRQPGRTVGQYQQE